MITPYETREERQHLAEFGSHPCAAKLDGRLCENESGDVECAGCLQSVCDEHVVDCEGCGKTFHTGCTYGLDGNRFCSLCLHRESRR